jgi:hypothetical protein
MSQTVTLTTEAASMPRELTETVQVQLRIKERERLQLAAAAEANGVSLNAEMAARIARTFRQDREWRSEQLAENVARYLGPIAADVHEIAMRGDLMRVADAMAALLTADSPPPRDEIEEVIARHLKVKTMIETAVGSRVLKMSTDFGAKP